jgi:hypothetical protein
VIGELLIRRSRIPFDGSGTFVHVSDDEAALAGWADWLALPG